MNTSGVMVAVAYVFTCFSAVLHIPEAVGLVFFLASQRGLSDEIP